MFSAMGSFQVRILAVLFCLNALDGFDVLAIAFAAPGISKDWSLSPQTLGFIISLGLFANAAGALLVAPIADRIGRRPMILLSLAAMTAGMLVCAIADNTRLLSAGRLITGVGVGALIPCISALASEYSSSKYRDSAVIIMAIGFPVGGLVGGQAAAVLLQHLDWRAVFLAGGLASGLLVLAPLLLVPESIDYLLVRQPAGALLRINSIRARLGQAPLGPLPVAAGSASQQSIFDLLLVPALFAVALTVMLAYTTHSATLYYSLNWIPKIVVDLGFTQPQAAAVAAWCSGGGIVGATIAAWLATRIQIRYLTIGTLAGAAASLGLFAHASAVMTNLLAGAVLLGAFLYAAQVSLYALMTRAFPVHVRATGVGFVTGVGRLGGIAAPFLSGYLLVHGLRYPQVSSIMALGSLLGALVLLATLRSAQRARAS
jgi:benzoate transport